LDWLQVLKSIVEVTEYPKTLGSVVRPTQSNPIHGWIQFMSNSVVAVLAPWQWRWPHHINEVKLHRARLPLQGLVTNFGGSTISVFCRLTQPCHPSTGVSAECGRWFRTTLGKKRQVLRISRPYYQDCWHTGLLYAWLP